LVRALACHARGRGFEPRRSRQQNQILSQHSARQTSQENRIGKAMGRQTAAGGAIVVDWFALIRPAVTLITGVMSVYDRVRGKAPIVDFEPGEYGAVLRLTNERSETVIIERIDAAPALLAFAAGREIRDLIKAQLRARPGEVEHAFAILRPAENIEVEVITINAFSNRPVDQKIKVTLQWRASSQSRFSRRTISKTITVRDVMDLVAESHRRRLRHHG
jgi:hypothetical protein